MESMALMEVGGASEVEVGEVKDRLDDALCATRGGPRRKKSRFQKCLRFWRFTLGGLKLDNTLFWTGIKI